MYFDFAFISLAFLIQHFVDVVSRIEVFDFVEVENSIAVHFVSRICQLIWLTQVGRSYGILIYLWMLDIFHGFDSSFCITQQEKKLMWQDSIVA